MADGSQIYTRLGLNPERVAGYVYAGLFTGIAIAIIEPASAKQFLESLGGFLSVISLLAIGFAVYVFYRYVVGEFLVYPIQHTVHRLVDIVVRRKGDRATSTMAFVQSLRVPLGRRRDAYTAIREEFLDETTRRRLDLVHGELHALYITAFGSFAVIGYLSMNSSPVSSKPWVVFGAIFLLAALIADTHQHSLETLRLRHLDQEKLTEFISKEGFLN